MTELIEAAVAVKLVPDVITLLLIRKVALTNVGLIAVEVTVGQLLNQSSDPTLTQLPGV